MDTSIYLFLTAKGYIAGRVPLMFADSIRDPALYINPLPSGLVLTGIVVSVSVTSFSLALVVQLYKNYKTLDLDEILMITAKEGE